MSIHLCIWHRRIAGNPAGVVGDDGMQRQVPEHLNGNLCRARIAKSVLVISAITSLQVDDGRELESEGNVMLTRYS